MSEGAAHAPGPERMEHRMGKPWKLGRVAGINIFLHPTFLLLLFYVGAMGGGMSAVVLTSAAFGCVLLHELGHALTARGFGIQTIDITLYPIGGVANLERIPRAPGVELLVALAGPAVNLVIAGFLWFVLGGVGDPNATLAGFLETLLLINLGLALFNLIPAFPMDGGRVMRALLSGWLGRVRATEIAVALGRFLAVAFGVFSLYHLAFFQTILATFIYVVAGRELASVRADELQRVSWPEPPRGFRWLSRGDGTFRLVPLVIPVNERRPWV